MRHDYPLIRRLSVEEEDGSSCKCRGPTGVAARRMAQSYFRSSAAAAAENLSDESTTTPDSAARAPEVGQNRLRARISILGCCRNADTNRRTPLNRRFFVGTGEQVWNSRDKRFPAN